MKRRYVILVLMAFWAIVPGCAGTGLRDDGSPIFGPRAWNEPPAPPQRQVMLTANRPDETADPAPRREGLAKFFPGLMNRNPAPAEDPRMASASATTAIPTKPRYRPTWFGLRPRESTVASGAQTYMTDNREQLNRSGASASALPVALQVPSDRMVTPTNAETPVDPGSSTSGTNPPGASAASSTASAEIPDFGGKPSKPGEDEVNPLPPAAEPNSPAVADRMPQVPPVDPLEEKNSTATARPATKPVFYDDAAPDMQAVKASTTPSEPPATQTGPPNPTQPTNQVVETSKMAVPSKTVYASAQSPPPSATKHTHVKPTTTVKPSPQGEETSWKRPCLRRLVRKVCHLGEFADPPTSAPH